MRHAVTLVADAILTFSTPQRAKVALSLGAYGATLTPSQEYPAAMSTEEALREWHAKRLAIFKSDPATWEKVEYVAFETIRTCTEVLAVRQAAHGVGRKWWISCVMPEVACREVKEVVRCMVRPLGERYETPWGIGVNCTAARKIGAVVELFQETLEEEFGDLRQEFWLVFYADGTKGEIYDTQRMEWIENGESQDDKQWDDNVIATLEQARSFGMFKGIVVGGCCKTMPKDIKRLQERIEQLLQNG